MKFMRATILAAAAFAALSLSACGVVPWNDQLDAGLTKAEVKWCESKDPARDAYICGAEITDGKEKDDVKLDVTHPSGLKVVYEAKAVKAFDAIKVRAAVEQSISADLKAAAPGVVEKIVDAVMGK